MTRQKLPLLIKISLILLFTLACNLVNAQVEKDTLLAALYFKKAQSFLKARTLDSSIVYFNKALPLYKNAKAWEKLANCHNGISENLWRKKDLDSSYKEANKALEICLHYLKKNTRHEAYAYDNIGNYYENISQLDKALAYYQKALNIQKKILNANHPDIIRSYNNFGFFYRTQRTYDKAIFFFQKALKTYQNIYPNSHKEVLQSVVNIASCYLDAQNYDNALRYYKMALKMSKELEEQRIKVTCITKICEIQTIKSLYQESITNANIALEIINKNFSSDFILIGSVYGKLATNYYYLGEYKTALDYVKLQLEATEKHYGSDHDFVAQLTGNLAVMYINLGDFRTAIKYYKKGLDILNNSPKKNIDLLATGYNNIGNAYRNLREFEAAMQYFEKALEVAKETYLESRDNISGSYMGMGIVYQRKSQFNRSLEYFFKALDIKLQIFDENSIPISDLYQSMGLAFQHKEDYENALKYSKKALKIKQSKLVNNHPNIGDLLNNIADIYNSKKEYAKAIEYNEKALTVWINAYGEDHARIPFSYINFANSHMGLKNYEKALLFLEKALHIRLAVYGDFNIETAKVYSKMGDLFYENTDFNKAAKYYKKSISSLCTSYKEILENRVDDFDSCNDANTVIYALNGIAKASKSIYLETKDLNQLKNCISAYTIADKLIHNTRKKTNNFQDKILFSDRVQELYDGVLESYFLLLKEDNKKEFAKQMFYYNEKNKSNTLLEILNKSYLLSFNDISSDLLDLEKHLKSDYSFYQSKVNEIVNNTDQDTLDLSLHKNKLFSIARSQDSLQKVIEQEYPKYYQLKYQNHITEIRDIQHRINKETTLLEFFTTNSGVTYAFTISKNNFVVKKLNTPGLNDQIEAYRKAITSKNTKNFKTLSHALHQLLIAPVKDQLDGDQLIIVPDGPLWHLNFDLLLTQNDPSNNPKNFPYLLKEYAINYANSATLLFKTQTTKRTNKTLQECLAFSFSDSTNTNDNTMVSLATLRDTGDDLPGTREEIRAISNIIDGQYFYGSQAIETNFKKNAEKYNILHLALHGEVDNERPENSRLFFTKSKDTLEDNLLYSHELFALDIPAELTVLSACNTGTGKIAKGEGIMSLGNAFQYAGTKSLLLASWEVSDQTTPELMKYFYTNLKKGMPKSKALQQAKLSYLQSANVNRTHPFYWGAFYLVGEDTPINFSNNQIWYWGIGIGVLALLLGIYFIYQRKMKNPHIRA